jgi:hypothetical protein
MEKGLAGQSSARPVCNAAVPIQSRSGLFLHRRVHGFAAPAGHFSRANSGYFSRVPNQQEAVKSAQEYLDLELPRYQTGIDPYLESLTAQNTLLSDQQTFVTLQIDNMVSAVDLVRHLAADGIASLLMLCYRVHGLVILVCLIELGPSVRMDVSGNIIRVLSA